MQQLPLTRDLVLIGGGHAHALALRMWAMDPLPGVRLTLISPDPTAAYSGMLPGHVAGHYPRAALQMDLVQTGPPCRGASDPWPGRGDRPCCGADPRAGPRAHRL
ncbi:hypothetical protein FALB51S_00269 [Frigidibacter albus]